MANRLADATSPYLLQHADNPVDWWEWSPEAFEEARARDVPVLLSVGYAACHWCHVMAHESFEDEATAAYMNEHYVNIKVDREERPDVDAVYMAATTAMTGQGGWPMTVRAQPRGRAVLRGHLLPGPAAAGPAGLPAGAGGALGRVDASAATRSTTVAADVAGHLRQAGRAVRRGPARRGRCSPAPCARLAADFDADQRRLRRPRPKFPPSMVLEFLLRHAAQDRCRRTRPGWPTRTLRAMARGGLLRPARRRLRALLASTGLGGAALREDALRQRPAARRLRPLVAADRRPAGRAGRAGRPPTSCCASCAPTRAASPSALDADTEGVEGQVLRLDARSAGRGARRRRRRLGGRAARGHRRRHLRARHVHAAAARRPGRPGSGGSRSARRPAARPGRPRVRPARDDKVVAAWNGLADRLARRGGRAARGAEVRRRRRRRGASRRRPPPRRTARCAASPGTAWSAGTPGCWRTTPASPTGCLALLSATGDAAWLRARRGRCSTTRWRFRGRDGGFFDTAEDAEPLLCPAARPVRQRQPVRAVRAGARAARPTPR